MRASSTSTAAGAAARSCYEPAHAPTTAGCPVQRRSACLGRTGEIFCSVGAIPAPRLRTRRRALADPGCAAHRAEHRTWRHADRPDLPAAARGQPLRPGAALARIPAPACVPVRRAPSARRSRRCRRRYRESHARRHPARPRDRMAQRRRRRRTMVGPARSGGHGLDADRTVATAGASPPSRRRAGCGARPHRDGEGPAPATASPAGARRRQPPHPAGRGRGRGGGHAPSDAGRCRLEGRAR